MQARFGLVGYLVAAALARSADAGATVGVVLLAVDPGLRLAGGEQLAGLLAAALALPHVLGPWVARALDRTHRRRLLLVGALAGYAVALAGGALLVGRVDATAVLVVAMAGTCGPMLTGGMSSQLPDILTAARVDRRRAAGLDAATYSVAAALGPAAVAVASRLSPLVAVLAMSATILLGAAVLAILPLSLAKRPSDEVPRIRQTLRLLVADDRLRRVMVVTCVGAAGFGIVVFAAALYGPALGAGAGSGAALVASFGLGSMAGAVFAAIFPLRGELELLTVRCVWPIAVLLTLTALAPNFGWSVAGFVAVGLATAIFNTASLAARAQYAPAAAAAQVFVSIAGLKIATTAAGSAAAGALGALSPRHLLMIGSTVLAAGAVACVLDRRAQTHTTVAA